MRKFLVAAMAGMALLQAIPALAQFYPPDQYDGADEEGLNEPYEPPRGLNFAELIASIPAKARPRSAALLRRPQRTLAQQRADATDVLRAAIPAGMPVDDATAKLRKAGADCGPAQGASLDCHFLQPRRPNDLAYSKIVRWDIVLGLNKDKVAALTVSTTVQ